MHGELVVMKHDAKTHKRAEKKLPQVILVLFFQP